MIAVVVMTDGRRACIDRAIPSLEEHLDGPVTRRVIHDDSADPTYQRWLSHRFPSWELHSTVSRAGFGGAIRSAWTALAGSTEPYVFATEDDFVVQRPVDLVAIAGVLDQHPHLAQLVLKRQPWNADERAAGGIIEQHPGDYTQVVDGSDAWVEHRRFFSTNTYMARASLALHDRWPVGAESEGRFTHQLLADGLDGVAGEHVRFAFWGHAADAPWVEHIGYERVGVGY